MTLRFELGREPTTPRDAATVLLLREAPEGFEVFMVRRHQKSGFMGGAYVFPGGTLDEADRGPEVLGRTAGLGPEEAGRRLGEPEDPARAAGLFVAAARETFEEAGILLSDVPGGAGLDRARAELSAGAPFSAVLEGLGAALRLELLTPWTRWITPAAEPRRYDTRFFLAIAPPTQRPTHDLRETTEAAWLSPDAALHRAEAGEIQLPPPTLRSLEMLRDHGTVREAIASAVARPPPVVEPVFHDEDGTFVLALPGDPAHPIPERRVPGPTRIVLDVRSGRWRSTDPPPA